MEPKPQAPRTKNRQAIQLLAALLCIVAVDTQAAWVVDYDDTKGFELGKKVILKPQTDVLGGYDNRVKLPKGGEAEGDFYSDIAVAAELENHPSVYNWWLKGRYGYRFFANETDLNNDFYTAAARIGTKKAPFVWKASVDLTKALDYSTQYNADTGQGPDSILTYQANTRFQADADLSYDKKWFGKTSLVPGYKLSYYQQEYDVSPVKNEWVIHQASLLLRQQYSSKTRIATGGDYSLQRRKEEDGNIGTLLVGVEHRMSKKTHWLVQLGYSVASYEKSGTDQGFVSRLRGNWQTTKKVSAYIFGGNQFRPGYNGRAARMVYRLGYGARWKVVPKFSLRGSVLHDYQRGIGDERGSSSYGDIRHFIDLSAGYSPISPLTIATGVRHNRDEQPIPQTQVYLSATYRFY